ncbi:tail collar fiber protein [Vibrio phage D479]
MAGEGTNTIGHVRDGAQYITLTPFTSAGKAFEAGGDVQSIMERFVPSSLEPYPVPGDSNFREAGFVRIATVAEAVARESVTSVMSPKKLNDLKLAISPPPANSYGFPRLVSAGDLDRDYATSDGEKTIPWSRLWDLRGTRPAITDDSGNDSGIGGTPSLAGFTRLANTSESLTYATNLSISPRNTWALVNQEILTRWNDALETDTGIIRGIAPGDARKADVSIGLTNRGLDYMRATPSIKSPFYLPDNNVDREDPLADQTAITPGTISTIQATDTMYGFASLAPTLDTRTDTTVTAAQGVELDKLLGVNGGRITGVLRADELRATYVVAEREYLPGGGYHYVNRKYDKLVFPNAQLDSDIGLEGRPVGSLYMTTNSHNPSSVFGGSWVKIQGRTPLGAGTGAVSYGSSRPTDRRSFQSGHTGGDVRVRVTESQIPSHKHAGWGETYSSRNTNECIRWNYKPGPYGGYRQCLQYKTEGVWRWGQQGGRNHIGMGRTDHDNYLYYNEPVGGGQSHENMQPYYVVNIWRRTR